MACDVISDKVASIFAIGIMIVDIVWQLRLVENGQTMVSIPDGHMSKSVFDSKSVSNDIIAVDNNAAGDWVHGVLHLASDGMVSTPQPCVVNDHISTVDLEHILSINLLLILVVSSTNSGKHIRSNARILR